ncbi:hypothetical protein EWM64_g8182 [Hericium alpestre]|uniref:Dolichyl-diphosphooligosaccharide--protein glycosyltransferase subunit 1 n=1 Tax=Hericium alpestre TaxID=135208 RepID=A0A4Y9ZM25_9AGAM|nr:hypothetical protein EWM64_g8182 [Hericium alpestre]
MAPSGDSAQVHPYLFTAYLLKLAAEKGVEFVKGRATVLESDSGHATGVRYIPVDGTEEVHIPADCIILAAGPWSPSLIPALPIVTTRAHSIVIKSPSSVDPNAVAPYALFTSLALPKTPRRGAETVTPEIYPRPNQTIYMCGPGDSRAPLPPTVDDVEVEKAACEQIWEWISESGIIERWALGEVTTCRRPFSCNVITICPMPPYSLLKLVFPEGATDIEVFPPFAPQSMTRSTHITYLDTIGRPVITFAYKDLTDRHAGVIYATYKVPFSAHLQKPKAVATAFLGLFALAIMARRVDLRISKT